jgi:excinuclease UvrABC nuclease subunit
MQIAAANLEYERAALLRDQIMELKNGTGLSKIEPKRKPANYRSKKQEARSKAIPQSGRAEAGRTALRHRASSHQGNEGRAEPSQ